MREVVDCIIRDLRDESKHEDRKYVISVDCNMCKLGGVNRCLYYF